MNMFDLKIMKKAKNRFYCTVPYPCNEKNSSEFHSPKNLDTNCSHPIEMDFHKQNDGVIEKRSPQQPLL